MELEKLIKENKGSILDVRSHAEFQGGHVANSINIPINEITMRMDEIKQLPTPLILCCASGARSGQASSYLSSIGIECINAGSWLNVNYLQSLNK